MQWLENLWSRWRPSPPGDVTPSPDEEEEIVLSAEVYELRLTQNDMLALCRAAQLSMGIGTDRTPIPLDNYERQLLQEFLDGANEAINSPGTFVTVENNDE